MPTSRYRNPEDAYLHDNTFHTVVDAIEAMIHRADITPSEARAAAVLACIHYEMRTVRTFTISSDLSALSAAETRIAALKRWIEDDAPAARETPPATKEQRCSHCGQLGCTWGCLT